MHHEPKTDAPIYPEGGLHVNLVVLGSFSSITSGLGLMNSIGIYQAWISTHQLAHLSSGRIGRIFGLYNFPVFFCGIQIGPIFDAKGPRVTNVVWFGSCCSHARAHGLLHTVLAFYRCHRRTGWNGDVVLFIVPVASIGHFFCRRRGAATGLALSGGSIGGVIFPLVLETLAPKLGLLGRLGLLDSSC